MIPEPPPPRELTNDTTVITSTNTIRTGSQSLPSHRRLVLPSSGLSESNDTSNGNTIKEIIQPELITSPFGILSSKPHERKANKAILTRHFKNIKATIQTTSTTVEKEEEDVSPASVASVTTEFYHHDPPISNNNNNQNLLRTTQNSTNTSSVTSLQNNIIALSQFNKRTYCISMIHKSYDSMYSSLFAVFFFFFFFNNLYNVI
jgi:hypothetical protein